MIMYCGGGSSTEIRVSWLAEDFLLDKITHEEQHHLVVLDGADQAKYRDQNQDHSAGQNATDDGQVGHDWGGASVNSDPNQQEADHLEKVEQQFRVTFFIEKFSKK